MAFSGRTLAQHILSLGIFLLLTPIVLAQTHDNRMDSNGGAAERQTDPMSTQDATPNFTTTLNGALDSDRVPGHTVAWTFLSFLDSIDVQRPGAALRFLEREVGLDSSASAAVLTFVTEGLASQKAYQDELREKHCDRLRAGSGLSAGAIASDLQAATDLSNQWEKGTVDKLWSRLDEESHRKLDQWIDKVFRADMNVVVIDFAKLLSQPGITPASIRQRLCGDESHI